MGGNQYHELLGCQIVDGNPADITLTEAMLDRQQQIHGRYPLRTRAFARPFTFVHSTGKFWLF
jgi:hypothetical protein